MFPRHIRSATDAEQEWTVNDMQKKLAMPRTREQFEKSVINAFIAGCEHGYSVDHTHDKAEQEFLGALAWVGRITREEASTRMIEIWNGGE